MAAPFFSTPFQPYVYQSQQGSVTAFQISGGDAQVVQINLANFGGELLCQGDAFLCSVNDVSVTNTVDQRPQNIEIGAEVILKQKLRGQGMAFVVGSGSVMQKILSPREVVTVDASCIVAMTTTISFQLKSPNQLRRAVFGGDNQLTASLTGPGVVFIQSLPFHRLSQRIASRSVAAPSLRENPSSSSRSSCSSSWPMS